MQCLIMISSAECRGLANHVAAWVNVYPVSYQLPRPSTHACSNGSETIHAALRNASKKL